MTILQQLNNVSMYIVCGTIVFFVAAMCIVFMVRAYRAGKAIGMDTAKMRRAITASVTFTILPAVGILLGVIALSGSLGTPWPWLRLSVIGALHYETQVAQAAAEQMGMKTLSAAEMTSERFVTIALLMSVCIMWGMVFSTFLNKRYTKKLGLSANNAASDSSNKAPGFGDKAMTAMIIGLVSAYIGSYIGGFVSGNGFFAMRGEIMPIVVAVVSAAAMAVFLYFSEKKRLVWLDSFSVAGSMIIGMAVAVFMGSK